MFRWFHHSRQVHLLRRPAPCRTRLDIEALEQRCLLSAWTTVPAANLGSRDVTVRTPAQPDVTGVGAFNVNDIDVTPPGVLIWWASATSGSAEMHRARQPSTTMEFARGATLRHRRACPGATRGPSGIWRTRRASCREASPSAIPLVRERCGPVAGTGSDCRSPGFSQTFNCGAGPVSLITRLMSSRASKARD